MKDHVYQIITDRIIGLLERGTVPWQKGWQGGEQAPQNLISGKAYRGVNTFLLHAMSYASPYWVSYKQASELGGHVKQGEKACPVVFWKWLQGEVDATTGKARQIPLLRYYSVFNVSQCDEIPLSKIPSTGEVVRVHQAIDVAERIVAAMPKRPELKHGMSKAFYSPSGDFVGLPVPEMFKSGEDYYSVLFHELTHSTGHESRLNRKDVVTGEPWGSLGSSPYAREELVAEMGAAFLCGECGIVERTIDNSAAYIAGWLKRLQDDPKLVVNAAAAAQKASDYILDRQFQGTNQE